MTTATSDQPTLDRAVYEEALGEPLPFRGLRMPALVLDQMLAGAVAFTDGSAEPLVPLDAVQLEISATGDLLHINATDRYSAYRESYGANIEHEEGSTFLLHRGDIATLRSLLKNSLKAVGKTEKDVLPVDLIWDDAGVLEVICKDRRAVFSEREHDENSPYPVIWSYFEKTLALTGGEPDHLAVAINADYLTRLRPLQKVHGVFSLARGLNPDGKRGLDNLGAVLARPLNPQENADLTGREVLVLLLPVRPQTSAA